MAEHEQITEIKRVIDNVAHCETHDDIKCIADCETCLAKQIYKEGYRKQREGKWIKATPCSQEYCNQCGLTPKTVFGVSPSFCPNCGAKMHK